MRTREVEPDLEVSSHAGYAASRGHAGAAGTRIRMLRGGSGPSLIFLHGASGHVGWLLFLDALSQRFRRHRAGASRLRRVG